VPITALNGNNILRNYKIEEWIVEGSLFEGIDNSEIDDINYQSDSLIMITKALDSRKSEGIILSGSFQL